MSITEEYSELVGSLAERARLIMAEGAEKSDAVRQAICDGLIYYDDEAIVIAHAFINGLIQWGKEVDWTVIDEDLFEDVYNDVDESSGA